MQIISIQFLRAIAAICVVYYHTFTPPIFGRFGVDLFFVISGFVMAMICEENRPSPRDFLVARLTRIAPLYWFITSLILILALIAPNLLNSTKASFSNFVLSILFIPHFRSDGLLLPLLMPGWTLNYEMAFYFTLALLLAAKLNIFRIAPIVLAGYYVIGHLVPPGSAASVFMQTTLWFEFVAGMICYRIYRNYDLANVPKVIWMVLSASALVFMMVAESWGNRLLVGGLPAAVLVLAFLQLEPTFRSMPKQVSNSFVLLGDASYSIYLSHIFSIALLERVIFGFAGITAKSFSTCAVLMLFSIAVGVLFFWLVDKPLVSGMRRFVRRFRSLSVAQADS